MKNSSWRHGFILIMLIITFYGVNGAFVIVTFASKMLTSTGIKFDISPEIQSLSFPIVMVIASLGLTIIVERCGRRVRFFLFFSLTHRVLSEWVFHLRLRPSPILKILRIERWNKWRNDFFSWNGTHDPCAYTPYVGALQCYFMLWFHIKY